MKAHKKFAASKIATRFDNELKNILMEDLRSFSQRNKFTNIKRSATPFTMSAA